MGECCTERALTFRCGDDWLVGVLSVPDAPGGRGVLVMVGGPQYRAGSHRQFTLLARHLAHEGIATMRFDCRGMGDSSGDPRSFEKMHDDLRAALDAFAEALPQVQEFVIWGLCDGASAAALYCAADARVTGLVLLNPWVRTQAGEANTMLRHYYRKRLTDAGFWRRAASGRVGFGRALCDFAGHVRKAARSAFAPDPVGTDAKIAAHAPLPERMADGLERFLGQILVILSGNDLVAQEFANLSKASPRWRKLLAQPRVSVHELPEANHTFSSAPWRDQVAQWTSEWLRTW